MTPRLLIADDGEVGERVADLLEGRLPDANVVLCGDENQIQKAMNEDGPFDVLVTGPSLCTAAGIRFLGDLRRTDPKITLLMIGSRPQQATMRDLMRAGAIDLLRPGCGDDELRVALNDTLEVARLMAESDVESGGRRHDVGRVITVSSATGGCGKTFFSTNLAYYLQRHTGGRVCIVDLDLQFGEVSTALRMRPRYTIFDALNRDETDPADLAEHIEEYLAPHETGVSVLAAPKHPAEADEIRPYQVTSILRAVRSRFDFVVVDTPGQLNEIVLAAFDQSEKLVVMATLDLPSIRNSSLFLNTLDKLRIPAENVRLVLNKAESDVGIEVPQVEKLFPQGFMSVLPYAKEVSRSINIGMPVLVSAPTSALSTRMAADMVGLLPADVQESIQAAAQPQRRRRGLFARLTAPIVRTA